MTEQQNMPGSLLTVDKKLFTEYLSRPDLIPVQPIITKLIWDHKNSLTENILSKFPNLRTLVCVQQDDLKAIRACPQLETLVLTYGKYTNLSEISLCPNLTKLICDGCMIEDRRGEASEAGQSASRTGIPARSSDVGQTENLSAVGSHPKLQVLKCIYSSFDAYDVIISSPCLKQLVCMWNNLFSLPNLNLCTNLTILNCSENHLTSLTGLGSCTNLQELDCSNNRLVCIADIAACKSLQILNCHSNKLQTLEGVQYLTNLQKLDCGYNQLTALTEIRSCTTLRELICDYNKLSSLHDLRICTELEVLSCNYNKLIFLEGIEACSSLANLACSNNVLTSLLEVRNCINLTEIRCNSNQMVSLRWDSGCPKLKKLVCYYNDLVSILELALCPNLEYLNCERNRLASLDGIQSCSRLRFIDCKGNQITDLVPIIHLRHLNSIAYSNNPLGIQSAPIYRLLESIRSRRSSSIYTDNQNVHDTHVQRSVCESVRYLLSDPKPTVTIEDIVTSGLGEKTVRLLVEYCTDLTVHSIHLLTYFELLGYVWARILRSDHKVELFRILEEQITDSECKCFTGRFNRTLSVLVGFYEDIVIEISDSSRIGAIILAIQQRIIPYDIQTHVETTQRELTDAGYSLAEISPWIDAISGSD